MMRFSGATGLGLAFVTLLGVAGLMAYKGAEAERNAPPPVPEAVVTAAAAPGTEAITVDPAMLAGTRDAPNPPAPVASLQPAAVTIPAAQPVQAPNDQAFAIKRILPITGPIKYGQWHWDEANVPAGPIIITVDLEARVLSVFRGGYEIGATAVLLGTDEKPTPLGVFPITQKNAKHISSLYKAPMPYMQRLTNDGVSIHATTVELGYASHGCIGVPNTFAKKLFETTHLGDKVIITRGKKANMGDSLVG